MAETEKIILEIKIPRETEYTPEAAASFFAGFSKNLSSPSFTSKLRGGKANGLILEIACHNQEIHFYAILPTNLLPYFESQILATYPLAILGKSKNYLEDWQNKPIHFGQMVQSTAYYYPLKTYKDFSDIDPLSSVLAVMSKASEGDRFLIQLVLEPAGSKWQSGAQATIDKGIKISEEETKSIPGESLIKQKIEEVGLKAGLRLAANSAAKLNDLAGTYSPLSRGDGNSLKFQKPTMLQKNKLKEAILNHEGGFIPRWQVLNVSELATIWHLPNKDIKVPNIAWGRSILSEPPENLPASINLSDEEKQKINFFAQTEFKNRILNFGIKQKDRRRHMYIVGKTGTGKSWLLANMAIDDFKKGRGVAVVDPHGDLCEILLDYIPSSRINDVCYFNPDDRQNPVSLNILEVIDPIDAELVTSGIVSIFYKLYGNSWGPRLEHILRSTVMTLALAEGTTLVDVLSMLSNKKFREKILRKVDDPILLSFWRDEFEKMPERLQKEAISPIQNKVGQFATSPLIRAIIGRVKSTITLESVMEEGKILLVNLSQGKLGEDNAALLGAMIITKIQQAAMRRVNIPEEQRRDFYLYVDEFQNFATGSFIKILSEARKYRLNLTLANQYMAQIDPDIQKAIFGNTGTMASFIVGADDAAVLDKEYGEVFSQNDLVSLDRFQIALKLTIDAQVSRPFLANTLPLPKSKNQNRSKILRVSKERYAYKKSPSKKTPKEPHAPV
ncbi:type IV secretory system conjugative DNA transfer family protein [Patescibacteria group bacterium]